jgi:LCP family protein required for cell wall assembly
VPGLPRTLRAFARRLVIALALSSMVMVGAVVAVNYVLDEKFEKIERRNVETVEAPTEVANFLVIGSDTRSFVEDESQDETSFGGASGEASGQRSDTLMVAHIDPNTKRAVVVSFPRDLWVEIPGVEMNEVNCARIMGGKCMAKINSAFHNGPDVVIQTLKQNFGIDIHHYIEINFKTFRGIVEAIGDVPVYFPYPTRDAKTGLYTPVPGCHNLDGDGALAYARARNIQYYSFPESDWFDVDQSGDIARIRRQQDFMRRLLSLAVAQSANNPLTAGEVIDEIVENLTVDETLAKEDLLSLVSVFSDVDPDDSSKVEFLTIPGRNGAAGSLSVLYLEEEAAAGMLAALRESTGSEAPPSTTDPSVTSSTLVPTTLEPFATTTTSTTTTTVPSVTTTTVPPLTIDEDRFGPPAEVTGACK